VRPDMNGRVLPIHELAVHPDLAGTRKSHKGSSLRLEIT
jgi:hypothetical protein